MRVSTSMLHKSAMSNLRSTLSTLARLQNQSASGRKISTLSDNPVDASQVMQLNSHLRDIDQYRRNASNATTKMNTEDAVLTTVQELMQTAQKLATGISSDDPNDPSRATAQAQITAIRDQIISLGNTRVGQEYIFGGAETASIAFRPDGTYIGDDLVRRTEVDSGMKVETNHTGRQLFTSSLDALTTLSTTLASGTASEVQRTTAQLSSASTDLLTSQAEIGIRLKEVQSASSQQAQRAVGLGDRRQELQDADPTETAVALLATQNALQQAYASMSRVLQTRLIDFLR